ncbi:MAG TPA: ABC transporter ATP-binding protein [Actinomycetota bacterium]|nr:ABC transporter ATP-binding protein [Actinomycetota bacterium]
MDGQGVCRPGQIRVRDLWEVFRVYHSRPMGVKEKLTRAQKVVFEDFWALKGVTFSLEPGESLAIIGPNGSGKSTLLKCLAGTLTPDRGSIDIGGKVAGLLELGAGFHPDLSGKENIYLNGSILGMRRKEIDALYERIVEFSGVGEFIENPVRNFSSGMYVRLGFAIAIQVDPDVLLLDEVLAVGDAEFQAKCFEKLSETRRRGRTVLLVTHDTQSAMRLCERAILLDEGRVVAEGPCREVVALYQQRVIAQRDAEPVSTVPAQPASRWGTGEATISSVELLDGSGMQVDRIAAGEEVALRMVFDFKERVEYPIAGFLLTTDEGAEVFGTNTLSRRIETAVFEAGDRAEVVFRQKLDLLPGRYMFSVALAASDGSEPIDYWRDCLYFRIRGASGDKGIVDLGTTIELSRLSAEPELQRPPQVLKG